MLVNSRHLRGKAGTSVVHGLLFSSIIALYSMIYASFYDILQVLACLCLFRLLWKRVLLVIVYPLCQEVLLFRWLCYSYKIFK